MIAGTLEIQLLANLARLTKDMSEAKATVEKSMKGIESAVASAKTVLAGLGIGFGVGYFASLIKGTIDAMDHLEHLKHSTGLTIEELSGLKLVAAESGTDLEGLAKAINKMSVAIGKNPEKFRELGVTSKDNKEALQQLADIFVSLTDVQQRNALAQSIFSKSWAEVAPALSMGGKALGEVMEKGARLSGITEENAKAAHAFKVQLVELETAMGATRNSFVAQLLPGLSDLTKAMGQAAQDGGALMAVWVGMGGALQVLATEVQKLLGMPLTEIAALEKDAKKITDYLAGLSSSVNPGVRRRYEEQLGVINARLDLLRQEKKIAEEAAAPKRKTHADGMDDAAIESIINEERAKRFLAGERDFYTARVANIKGQAAALAQQVKVSEELTRLAFQEAGIDTLRTREALLDKEAALTELGLRRQLKAETMLKEIAEQKQASASKRGEAGAPAAQEAAKDAATAAGAIAKIEQGLAENVELAEQRKRTARALTSIQQLEIYNSFIATQTATGEALADAFGDQRTVEERNYQAKLTALDVYLKGNEERQSEAERIRAGMARQHRDNVTAIAIQEYQNRVLFAKFTNRDLVMVSQATFGVLAELMSSHSRRMFRIGKAAAIVNTIVNTYDAAMRAFKSLAGIDVIGPALGAAAAAAVVVVGLQRVQQIKNTDFDSGGGGSPSGGGSIPTFAGSPGSGVPSTPIGGSPGSGIVVNVTVQGNVVGNRDFVDGILIPAIKDAVDNRDFTIIGSNSRQAADLKA